MKMVKRHLVHALALVIALSCFWSSVEAQSIDAKSLRRKQEIQEREKELQNQEWRLGDPEVFKDPERIGEVQVEKDRIQEVIDGLYAGWERLSDELAALEDA